MDKFSEPSDTLIDAMNSLSGWKRLAEAAETKVEALLAELEASSLQCRGIEQERELFRLERTAHQLHARALEQRIAELEDDKRQLNEIVNSEANRANAAEKRLATPMRLPDIRSDDYHETGWFQHMKYYRDVERAISAAGFTVGDEQ